MSTKDLNNARHEFDMWLEKEDFLWKQRSWAIWLREGDKNIIYFHGKALAHIWRNNIDKIQIDFGDWLKGAALGPAVADYFQTLFSSSSQLGCTDCLERLRGQISKEMNEDLCKNFTTEEVIKTLSQMNPTKAPGLDGMRPLFF